MLCPILRFIKGDISASECKELYSSDFLKYTTDFTFYQDYQAEEKGAKVNFAYAEIIKLIDKIEAKSKDGN